MANDADMSGWTDLLHSSTKLLEQAAPSAQFPPLQVLFLSPPISTVFVKTHFAFLNFNEFFRLRFQFCCFSFLQF